MSAVEEYKDYSDVSEDDQILVNHKDSSTNNTKPCFASRLHYLLSEIEKDGCESIVGWQPHGRSFVVRDRKKFVDSIISRLVKQKS